MGEGALLAKHCFASARTHSRQRLGRAPEGDLQRPRTPTPPRHPMESPLLLLLLLLVDLHAAGVAVGGRAGPEHLFRHHGIAHHIGAALLLAPQDALERIGTECGGALARGARSVP